MMADIEKTNQTVSGKNFQSIYGCLLGTAIGDSIGLPFEGVSRRRVDRWIADKPLQHCLVFGRGMFSDDTEQTCIVAAALALHSDASAMFQSRIAKSLRWWLAALPAGCGKATAQSILRLWVGVSPKKSGVYSAGNGAAMRSAIIGVYFCDHPERRREFVDASSRVTHSDARAIEAAQLVAEAAALAVQRENQETILKRLQLLIESSEMEQRFATLTESLSDQDSVYQYANSIGSAKGVLGFAPDSVSVAIYAWLRHRRDFETMITELVRCGGDTDTIAAIAGGIAGAESERSDFPEEWQNRLADWPITKKYLNRLAESLAVESRPVPRIFWPLTLLRNIVFLMIVFGHIIRRCLPLY